MLNYDDLSPAQTEALQAANQRYHVFLGHCGPLDEQGRADRAQYEHLMTRSAAGKGCVTDEQAVAFLMAVTGLPYEVCMAYHDA